MKNEHKKLSGLYLFSSTRSLGKSSLINVVQKLVYSFKHCLSDNGWQEEFDVDTSSAKKYEIYLVDGINDAQAYDFNLLENICDQNVSIKRRNAAPGTLYRGTPFLISSNLSPYELFGQVSGNNLSARAMILNISSVQLFPIINEIIRVHGLEPYEENNLAIPDDILNVN